MVSNHITIELQQVPCDIIYDLLPFSVINSMFTAISLEICLFVWSVVCLFNECICINNRYLKLNLNNVQTANRNLNNKSSWCNIDIRWIVYSNQGPATWFILLGHSFVCIYFLLYDWSIGDPHIWNETQKSQFKTFHILTT